MAKDYYEILGVPKNAAMREIKLAYIKLSKKYHPDLNNSNTALEFKIIKEAYETLSNLNERKKYDDSISNNVGLYKTYLTCPRCNNDLTPVEKRGIIIDYCDNCHGVWFDINELEDLSDDIKEFNFVAPRIENLKIAKNDEETVKCPRCSAQMHKVTMRGKHPVFDCCPNDHGYWFDEKELEEYIKANMTALKKPSSEDFEQIIKK